MVAVQTSRHGANPKEFTAVDLFAGCGGLSLGLKWAGFRIVAAVEVDAKRAQTYALNHPDTRILIRDIRKVGIEELTAGIRPGQRIDLVAGCPPCQGFSRIRRRNAIQAVSDPRNDLVLEFVRLVRAIRPKAVMLENVPGLENDPRFATLLRSLRACRYKVTWRVLDLAHYGVPQRRKRLVLLAWHGSEPPNLDQIAKGPRRTVRDALEQLPTLVKSAKILHSVRVRRSNDVIERIRHVPLDGGSRSSWPQGIRLDCHQAVDGFRDVYGRMAWDSLAPTITGGCINPSKGRFLHPSKHRAITLLEAARLQTFPVWYSFDVNHGRYPIAAMIGEALPPRFAGRAATYLKTGIRL